MTHLSWRSSRTGSFAAKALDGLAQVLHAAVLLTVPFTSVPLIGRLTRGSPVSPLALVPAGILAVLWLMPTWRRCCKVPVLAWPLLAFLGWAMVSSALGVFHELYPFREQTLWQRELRGVGTLLLGVFFYVSLALFAMESEDLTRSIRLVTASALPALLWGSVQAYWIVQGELPPARFQSWHRMLSLREVSFLRVTGVAFEPSWFANQLVVLYLPLWGAALLTGRSALRRGKSPILETLLFGWGLVLLYLTFSRIGWLSAMGVLGGVALWLAAKGSGLRRSGSLSRGRFRALLRLGAVLLVLALLAGALVYLGSRVDRRIAQILQADYLSVLREEDEPLISLANRLAYAERVMYWSVGLRTFSLHPFTGVGLGNTGFRFPEVLPAFGYNLPEMLYILEGSMGFPNPKSLWVRLLAETGIVGFVLFVGWLLVLAMAFSRPLRGNFGQGDLRRIVLLAALLSLGAMVFEGFSLDTFALPQIWVLPALGTGAALSAGVGEGAVFGE